MSKEVLSVERQKFLFVTTFLIVCLLLTLSIARGQERQLSEARPEIERLINESNAKTVGVAAYDLKTRQQLFINEHVVMHAASTMKLPVMMEVFRLASMRKLKLSDRIEVKNYFASIIDRSKYELSAEGDADPELYKRIGEKLTILELVERMIERSSNLATNLLIERTGTEQVTNLIRRLGGREMTVRRGVEDTKAFHAGVNNTTTAYDLMLQLRSLAEKRFLNARACEHMISILTRQKLNRAIPAGLPSGIRVAHKTGTIQEIKHDAGIIFVPGRRPYILVVLTRGIADRKQGDELIANISRIIYQTIVPSTTPFTQSHQ